MKRALVLHGSGIFLFVLGICVQLFKERSMLEEGMRQVDVLFVGLSIGGCVLQSLAIIWYAREAK